MKNCPYCNTAIQDDAKFCLNCMMSLKQKKTAKVKPFAVNKRLLSIVAGVLVCALTALSVGLFLDFDNDNDTDEPITTIIENYYDNTSTTQSGTNQSDGTSQGSSTTTPNTTQNGSQITGDGTQNNLSHQTGNGSDNNNDLGANSSGKPVSVIGGGSSGDGSSGDGSSGDGSSGGGSSGDGSSGGGSSGDGSSGGGSSGDGSSGGTTSNNTVPTEQVRYSYRALTKHDLEFKTEFYLSGGYPSNYCDNKIVLTGVLDASDNGVYIIPEKIDGYEVHTISGYLFASKDPSKVKCVVLPKTVKSITHCAFAFCTNLENVYCLSTYLDCENYAFCDELFSSPASDKITFYCLDNCLAPTYNEPVYFKDRHFLEDITVKVWDGVLPF